MPSGKHPFDEEIILNKNKNKNKNSFHCFSLDADLVLVLIKDAFTIERMLSLRHPFTRDLFIHQSLQADIGKRMLASPPASLLSRYGRNRIRAGRRTKTQMKRVIQSISV